MLKKLDGVNLFIGFLDLALIALLVYDFGVTQHLNLETYRALLSKYS
jgi:hypothetical protein